MSKFNRAHGEPNESKSLYLSGEQSERHKYVVHKHIAKIETLHDELTVCPTSSSIQV